MRKSRYLYAAGVVLAVCMVFGWEFVTAAQTGQNEQPSRLAVLWTSADADVARNVCFMYTHAAKKQKWFDEVKLIVWGPSARLLAGDKDLQEQVKQMIADGVILQACVMCADRYGASEALRKLGIEVRGMGKPLTEILKSDWKVLTF
ncbi:MAG TPA: DsrE family protein [Sedimentisphaerales bacterium]|nr:DsrE family protein [Sedimentisphaerales bacterium]